jgi:hypothetical protein
MQFQIWLLEKGKEMSRNSKILASESSSSSSSKQRTAIKIYCKMQCRICFVLLCYLAFNHFACLWWVGVCQIAWSYYMSLTSYVPQFCCKCPVWVLLWLLAAPALNLFPPMNHLHLISTVLRGEGNSISKTWLKIIAIFSLLSLWWLWGVCSTTRFLFSCSWYSVPAGARIPSSGR